MSSLAEPVATTPTFSPSPRMPALIGALVLAPFLVFSLWVAGTHGPLGFLALAGDEPWALQMLLDLVIACSFAVGWMVRDARRRRLTVWPFVAGTVVAGSIGLLAYLIRRGFSRV